MDFYLKGTADDLSKLCFPMCKASRDLLFFLLSHQFVVSDALPDRIWEVKTGSGIGHRASGEIADFFFYHFLEKKTALDPHVRKQFEVRGWLRYRDDIFIVVSHDYERWALFFKLLRTTASPVYELEIDSYPAQSAKMLDVEVFIKNLRFGYRPYRKVTSQRIPLLAPSGHSPEVLHSWPAADIVRLRKRSSKISYFEAAKAEMLEWYASHGMSESALSKARDVQFTVVPSQIDASVRATIWCVMPFHPSLCGAPMPFVANSVALRWLQYIERWFGNFKFRCCWRLVHRHQAIRLAAL